MIKLPEKKYVPKRNDELRNYTIGWNTERYCLKYGEEDYTKENLLKRKEKASKEFQFYKGVYDCIVEIERLNEEPEHKLDNFFQDSLEALDKLTIKSDDELDKKLEELNKYNEDRQLRML